MLGTTLRRIGVVAAGALLALPVATLRPAVAGEVGVPGCFGVESAVFCEVTVEYALPLTVGTYQDTVTVCAGSCEDVDVTLVSVSADSEPHVCVSWQDRAGNQAGRQCAPLTVPPVGSCQGETGVVVGDTEVCQDLDELSRYQVRRCFDGGYYVYDSQTGRTVLNLCLNDGGGIELACIVRALADGQQLSLAELAGCLR